MDLCWVQGGDRTCLGCSETGFPKGRPQMLLDLKQGTQKVSQFCLLPIVPSALSPLGKATVCGWPTPNTAPGT